MLGVVLFLVVYGQVTTIIRKYAFLNDDMEVLLFMEL